MVECRTMYLRGQSECEQEWDGIIIGTNPRNFSDYCMFVMENKSTLTERWVRGLSGRVKKLRKLLKQVASQPPLDKLNENYMDTYLHFHAWANITIVGVLTSPDVSRSVKNLMDSLNITHGVGRGEYDFTFP